MVQRQCAAVAESWINSRKRRACWAGSALGVARWEDLAKLAKALGINVPLSPLALANEVIE